ncbi:hypothetical protein BGX28_010441 [Mortierella sp. GBA30]|nr:hypothetical protein BGX28_010441 [Mortierella sp. GBA30]
MSKANSLKKSGHKSHKSTTIPCREDIFVHTATTDAFSTAATRKIPSSTSNGSPTAAENLETLDHDEDDQMSFHTDQYDEDREHQSQISHEQCGADFWSWITSNRTVSEEQLLHEAREEQLQLATHLIRLESYICRSKDIDAALENNENDIADIKRANPLQNTRVYKGASDMTSRDWTMISIITIMTLIVRFWRISWPDEVVSEEASVGKIVNAYIKNEFAFDAHPPLGKLILTGISSLSNYSGVFGFDDIGDSYPGHIPYVAMRATMALMGALCGPMAYVTVKVAGQGASAAILAATLVAFATLMSWNMFIKNSSRPFAAAWWAWLMATGVSVAGAMSVKLAGITTAGVVAVFLLHNLWSLTKQDFVTGSLLVQHCAARMGALIALPFALYLAFFYIHLSYQTHTPDYHYSPQAENDLRLLSAPFRHALVSKHSKEQKTVWRDVVYGSVVQLQSESQSQSYLHSFHKSNPGGSQQQQVGGYEYPDLNTHWIVILADVDKNEPEEIPSRLQYLRNGDNVRLRHVSTRRCLHSHDVRTYVNPQSKELHEVSAYGEAGMDGDANDWWKVEVVDTETMREMPVKDRGEQIRALETAFRLKHSLMDCYLYVSESTLPEPWGEGRREIVCRSNAGITPKSIWRFTMNEHDYLPMDTSLASYPTPSFWQKFKEMHWLMWFPGRRIESGVFKKKFHISASAPLRWPLAQSLVLVWTGYMRQVAIVANPLVWWTGTFSVAIFLATKVVFVLREKRGYFETGYLREHVRKDKELRAAQVHQEGSHSAQSQPLSTNAPSTPPPGRGNDFLTVGATFPIVQDTLAQESPQVPKEHNSPLRVGLSIAKPERRLRSPVLEPHFPLKGKPLPMQGVILLPYQQPPQHWEPDVQPQMLNRWTSPYAQQQILQLIREQPLQEATTNVEASHEPGDENSGDFMKKIPAKDDLASSAVNEVPASLAVHTKGLLYPGQYEGRPDYQRREQMISAAAVYASKKKAQEHTERNPLLALFPTKENISTSKAREKEEAIRYLQRAWKTRERFNEKVKMDIVDDALEQKQLQPGHETEEPHGRGGIVEDQELEYRGPPITVSSQEELDKVLRQLQEEGVRVEVVRGTVTETIEPTGSMVSNEAGDEDEYQSNGENPDDGTDEYGEKHDEEHLPPIMVKDGEELAMVLERLAAEGIVAEVVEGTATRYVEPSSSTA